MSAQCPAAITGLRFARRPPHRLILGSAHRSPVLAWPIRLALLRVQRAVRKDAARDARGSVRGGVRLGV